MADGSLVQPSLLEVEHRALVSAARHRVARDVEDLRSHDHHLGRGPEVGPTRLVVVPRTAVLVVPPAVGVLDETLTAVARILTNPRVGTPQTPTEALDFCDRVRTAPAVTRLEPAPNAWATFTASVIDLDLRANDIPDAWLAAVVSTSRATLLTFDRGFGRFRGLDMSLLRG